MIVRAKRGTRRYRVEIASVQRRLYRLRPIGDDVVDARDPTTGQWQGGVRSRLVAAEALLDRYEVVEP